MALSRENSPRMLMWIGYSGMFFFLPFAHSPVEICGALVLAAWIISGKFVADTRMWLHAGTALPVLFLILLPWIGLSYSQAISDGLQTASRGYYWLYSIAMVSMLRSQRHPDLVIKMFLAGLALNCVVSALQIGGLVRLRYGNPSGLLGISSPWITYSLLLTVGILISSFYFQKAQDRQGQFLSFFMMLFYFGTIGFVGGRSGYLAFIILSPLLVYNLMGRRHILRILLLSFLAAAFLFTFPVVRARFGEIKEDMVRYQQGDISTSVGLRLHMWGIALNEIKKNPFLGIGTEGFKKSWEMNKKDQALPFHAHPHNSFLYMMVSFGPAGLIAFCWLLLVMVRKGWRNRETPLGFALFSFTLVLIIGSLTDTQILPFPTATAYVLFAGIAGAIEG